MKKLLAWCLTALMTLSLTSCGTSAAGSKPDGVSDTGGEPVTIHFFNAIIENVDWYEDVIARFESENPGIKVEMEFQKDYDAALKVKFQTGDVPVSYTHLTLPTNREV